MFNYDKRIKRMARIYSWRNRIPPRTFVIVGGKTVSSNSVFSFDGISTDVQDRRILIEKKVGKNRNKFKRSKDRVMLSSLKYTVSSTYVAIMLLTGSYLQGWFGWLM